MKVTLSVTYPIRKCNSSLSILRDRVKDFRNEMRLADSCLLGSKHRLPKGSLLKSLGDKSVPLVTSHNVICT